MLSVISLILNAVNAISSVFALMRGHRDKRPSRTGIRMKGGKGTFEKTRIRGQDIAIDTDDTKLDMKDTDIK